MNRILLLAAMLIIALITYGQPKTQPTREKLATAVLAQPQQTPGYDPNNPASWPDSLDAVVAAPQNHKVVP